MKHLLPLAAAILVALAIASVAHADGEAGVVIQDGDTVQTFCIPFSGDSVAGDALLEAAGIAVQQTSGGGRAVCSLDDVGCFPDDCFCQCKGGSTCTYWAFFTKRYGGDWVYSSLAFNLTRSKDGDLQGWKWGAGSAQSAPPPRDVSFEQVCGHPPRGQAAQPPTATVANSPAPGGATTAPATATRGETTSTETETGAPETVSTGTIVPVTSITMGNTSTEASVSAAAASTSARRAGDDGGAGSGVIAFAAVAAVLAAGIAAALLLRRRRAGGA